MNVRVVPYTWVSVLLKTTQLEPIVTVIQRAAQGMPVLPPSRREELIQLWLDSTNAADARHKRLAYLTPREAEVLRRRAEVVVDGLAPHALHDVERAAVGVGTQAVNGHDSGVLQLAADRGLLQ